MESKSVRWTESYFTLLLAAVLFPPLGIFLLWKSRRCGVLIKLFGSLCICVIAIAHLYIFFGLRVEVDGSALRPIFYFGTRESHYEALEADRARQRSHAPPLSTQLKDERKGETISALEPNAYWTDFRGPNRDGHYREMNILTDWSGGLEELWRQKVGGGYASIVIAEGKAFTIEQRRDQEVVAAYDMETGRELWTSTWKAHFQESMGGPGPRATPTWNEGMIYAQGAEGELRCLDADSGRMLWSKNILDENQAENLTWAMAASPLIVDDMVIVLPGGRQSNSVVAYNKRTGSLIWQALSDRQAYTSPMTATLAGRRQLLIVSAERVAGLTLEDGELLWDYPWSTDHGVNAAQPLIVDSNRVYISAGYRHGAALIEVTKQGSQFKAQLVWETHRMKNKISGAVLHQGYIYGLDEAILACIEVETGKLMWKGGRYGYGQLLLAGGHLIVITEKGDLVLVKADPERHIEISRFSALNGKTWNNPAIGAGRLLVRNAREMACFRITREF